MILLGEAFYCRGKSLNLSFEGGGTSFVPLIVIGGRHQVSKYHMTLCLGNDSMAYKRRSPQTTTTDDTKNR